MGTKSANKVKLPPKPEWIIVGLDSSTTDTGISAVEYSASSRRVLAYSRLQALDKPGDSKDREGAMWRRIWEIKYHMSHWMGQLPFAVDALAYECPQVVVAKWGLRESTRQVYFAIGSYLSLSCFKGLEKFRVGTMTAAAIYGGCGEPTERKKDLATQWANEWYRDSLDSPFDNATIPDSLAPTEVAWRKIQHREWGK